MDPASIIGVIGVAAQALKIIKAYGDAVSDCRDEVAGLRVELFCLRSALTQIERDVLLAPEHETAEFRWMLEEARSLLVSLTESIQVGASRGSRLAQRLTWPLKRQHVKGLTGQLERMKTYFILVATSDTRDATRVLSTSLDEIQQSLADMRTSEEDKVIQAAVDTWLTSFDPEIAHHAALSARFEGTNRWFLDGALAEWLKSNSRLLWLRGKPGAGKTCIAAASAARLLDNCKSAYVSHFYCSYNTADSQRPRTVIASLLRQLAHKDSSVRYVLTQAYMADLEAQHGAANITANTSLLTKLLISVCTDTAKDIYFVVDAINEGAEGSKEIVQAIFSVASQCPRMRIVLTSTESTTTIIEESSDRLKLSRMGVSIGLKDVKHDIDSYIDSRFGDDQMLSRLRPQLQDQIKEKLKLEHNGSFRWAQCTIDDLSCLATPKAIKNALASITPSLSNVYKAVMQAIPSPLLDVTRSMLVCLVSALRPLSLRALADAAVFTSYQDFTEDDRLTDPEAILGHLRSLVRYEPATKRVELAHSSVRRFLTDPERSGVFYIDEDQADRIMCCICIGYLILPAFKRPCPDSQKLNERKKEWPFLRYASELWVEHVRLLGEDIAENIQAMIRYFFDTSSLEKGGNFAAWYQCMFPERDPSIWNTKPLYICAREGLVDLLRIMLPAVSKEQLEERGGSRGSTPLHVAAAFGEVEAVEALLAVGADPNERNEIGENGMQWAWFWGHATTVEALLKGGAHPELIQGKTVRDRPANHPLQSANIFLDELQRRNELGADAEKLEPLPLYLATLQSQAADEHLARRIQEESTSSDFKIPPRAQPGSRSDPERFTNQHDDMVDSPT